MGNGKTTATKRLINKYKRILFITPRISFAKWTANEFNFTYYKNVKSGDKPERLVCSLESLEQFKDLEFDLILFNESEANLEQFTSTTIKNEEVISFEILNKKLEIHKRL